MTWRHSPKEKTELLAVESISSDQLYRHKCNTKTLGYGTDENKSKNRTAATFIRICLDKTSEIP